MIQDPKQLRLASPDDAYISAEDIDTAIRSLADYYNREIYSDTPGITAVAVLNGAKPFAKAFMPLLETRVIADEMKVSSMNGTSSSGRLVFDKHASTDVENKDVLVIEDLVDTGLTLSRLTRYFIDERNVRSLHIVSLFEKPECRIPGTDIPNLKTGISISDKFVIGFGLDWNNKYRDLNYLTTAVESTPGFYEPVVKFAA